MIDHETFTWFAAIDWGTEKHQACVVDVRGGIAGERAFSHDGAGLALLCDWILSIAGNATIVAVAVEVRFPHRERPHMPGSPTTPGPAGARNDAPASFAFRGVNNVGTRRL